MNTERLPESARLDADIGAGGESNTSTGPSKTAQVMIVLLHHAVDYEHALSGKQIHRLTQMEPDDVHRVLSRLSGLGQISKEVGFRGWLHYWLDPDQAYAASAYAVVMQRGVQPLRHLSVVDVTARLRFLATLKERTVFGEYAMLDHIIEDYRKALREHHLQEIPQDKAIAGDVPAGLSQRRTRRRPPGRA